jgi:uracil-DNA glycosylase
LLAEIEAVRPRVVVCMGSTAVQALLGPKFRLTRGRGQAVTALAETTVVPTYHPSAILRARTSEDRAALWRDFVEDLEAAQQRALVV